MDRRDFLNLAAGTLIPLPGATAEFSIRKGLALEEDALLAALLEFGAAHEEGRPPRAETLARLAPMLERAVAAFGRALGSGPEARDHWIGTALSLAAAMRLEGRDYRPLLQQVQALLAEQRPEDIDFAGAVEVRARQSALLLQHAGSRKTLPVCEEAALWFG
jgi:hypothetical protein